MKVEKDVPIVNEVAKFNKKLNSLDWLLSQKAREVSKRSAKNTIQIVENFLPMKGKINLTFSFSIFDSSIKTVMGRVAVAMKPSKLLEGIPNTLALSGILNVVLKKLSSRANWAKLKNIKIINTKQSSDSHNLVSSWYFFSSFGILESGSLFLFIKY